MDLNKDLIFKVIDAAKEAGVVITDLRCQKGFEVKEKSDGTRVTSADIASNEKLKEKLVNICDLPIISEEDPLEDYPIRSEWERFWMIDPVDGTDELINLDGTFCINVALIENNLPVLGVIYYPVTNSAHYAFRGGGAFFWDGKTSKKINTAPHSDAIKIVCSKNKYNEATKSFVEKIENHEVVYEKGTCKFGMVASGEVHIHPKFNISCEWDTAPAQIIIEEAGGSLVSASSGKPLIYNKRDMYNPHFIASY